MVKLMSLEGKIIIKSLELFEVYGIKRITMDDIAEAMGISKKTIYVHFKGKNELVNNCIQHLFSLHFFAIESIITKEESPLKNIKKIYEYAVNYLIKVAPIFHSDLKRYYSEAYQIYIVQRRKIIFGIIKSLLDEGQLKGEIDQTINTKLFCEFHLVNLDQLINNQSSLMGYSLQDVLNNTIRVSLNGIIANGK